MKPNHKNEQPGDREPAVWVVKRDHSRYRVKSLLFIWLFGLAGVCGYNARGQYIGGIVIPEGYVQVEGDIIMTTSNAAVLLGPHPKFSYAPARLWPNRVVPFDFDAGVTPPQQAVFVAAMTSWQNSFPGVTTITFQPRNGEAGYLHLLVANPGFVGGSTDYVGYNGGTVTMTVHSNAVAQFLIAHELGHALGLWHEQSRDDRDSYLTILTGNIQSGYSSQFDKKSPESTFGQYDYDSLMQYFACAFSKCTTNCNCPADTNASCITMQVVPQYNVQQCVLGQLNHLSAMDQRSMAFMYGPPSWKFLYSKPGSSATGDFQQPYTSVSQAVPGVPANGTLWLGPGTYSAAGMTISTPMTLKASIPDLQLQANGSLGPSPSGYATLQ